MLFFLGLEFIFKRILEFKSFANHCLLFVFTFYTASQLSSGWQLLNKTFTVLV